jgi:peptidylprolyl isomerase
MRHIAGGAAAALALLVASPAAAQTSGWRTVDPENLLVIDTTKGRILVEIADFAAPGHAARIKTLARQGFYDGQIFHRVIDDFMAQTGDPTGTGTGDSGLPDLPQEFTFRRAAALPVAVVRPVAGGEEGFIGSLPVSGQSDLAMIAMADRRAETWGIFCDGVAGMARLGSDVNSANSQFFVMRARWPNQQRETVMDRTYTAWGRVVAGLDVVKALAPGSPPPQPDRMIRTRLAADLAGSERPTVRVMDPRGPAFRALIAQARTKAGAGFSACDVELPVEVTAPPAG